MATAGRWYGLAYDTVTGAIVNEIPFEQPPQFDRQINQTGAYTITTPVGGVGALGRDTLRSLVSAARRSIAICYGGGSPNDVVIADGPVWSHAYDDTTNLLSITGAGPWSLLSARLLVPANWTTATGFGSATSDVTYTGSYHDIARSMIADALSRAPLPWDLPAAVGGSSATETYHGYDMGTVGTRLAELTQLSGGPDIDFAPYITPDGLSVRHSVIIGNPSIGQPAGAVAFDYPGNVLLLSPSNDGTALASTVYAKGSGTQYAVAWNSATSTVLTSLGWPPLESVDDTHTDQADPAVLASYAQADIALHQYPVETWPPVVPLGGPPALGIDYAPGYTVNYTLSGHRWVPDGTYSGRILGWRDATLTGQTTPVAQHILQAAEGVV